MYRGLARVLILLSTPPSRRNEQKKLKKGPLFSAPNSGMHKALIEKISENR